MKSPDYGIHLVPIWIQDLWIVEGILIPSPPSVPPLIYVDITYASSPWLFGHLDQCGVGGAAAKMPPSRAPSGNDDGGDGEGGADSMFVRPTVSETG